MRICSSGRGTHGDINYLASPVTGSGVAVNRFQQLFLLARSRAPAQPEAWARFTWEILAAHGHVVVKDGAPLATSHENLAELTAQANAFAAERLPILVAQGVA
jgi:hypothetical protein